MISNKLKKRILASLALLGSSLFLNVVYAHNAICSCYYEADEMVLCEGGFSDGSSAEGVDIRVLDDRERVLLTGKINEEQIFTFKLPSEFFHVVMDAGDNHQIVIYQDEIEE
ncbi:MAG: hypothetical protein DHS20C12_15870 [Pseudohongiella sp.]|nr:MAG: hypothetical protein DHS20C12_15870 [Pseudohongiella sp.]